MKKIHLAIRSAARDHVQTVLQEALGSDFQAIAGGLFRVEIEGMLEHALQAELATFLGRNAYERTGKGGCVKSLGVEFEVDGCVMPLSGVG